MKKLELDLAKVLGLPLRSLSKDKSSTCSLGKTLGREKMKRLGRQHKTPGYKEAALHRVNPRKAKVKPPRSREGQRSPTISYQPREKTALTAISSWVNQ